MILKVALIIYRLLWVPLLPVIVVYLWRRSRKDSDYIAHLSERFGRYRQPLPERPLWFHAVSLGEVRSAVGLIRLALSRGERIVVTHFTPAGRRETERQFANEIASGQLAAIYVPFDIHWCYRRFFRACDPRIGLTLEVEIWPAMIMASKAAGIPLFMCNAQYGTGPFARDSRGLRLRQRLIPHFAGAFVKSAVHRDRLASVGLKKITITGELRFDQPIKKEYIEAATALRKKLAGAREVIAIASGVEAEESLYLQLIREMGSICREAGRNAPLFVYVPRAPERFEAVASSLEEAGLTVLRRSKALNAELQPQAITDTADVFLGDSLGEMFFYLGLSDRVVVGAGFTPHGAHNIIEPLMLSKPVVTGPSVWTIEFPFVEAAEAGLAKTVKDGQALLAELMVPRTELADSLADFLAMHSGSSKRTLEAIDAELAQRNSRAV